MDGFLKPKNKLLLHICCAGCGAFVGRLLAREFYVTYFFYNPNIYPAEEYQLRLAEVKRVAKESGIALLAPKYDHEGWLDMIRGYEHEPERGGRCLICYRERLDRTAIFAQEKGFDYFASTLTVSPYKVAGWVNKIGVELTQLYGVKFLAKDFKKQDGYKKAVALSRELNLYRQDYCGCEFSRQK